MGLSVAGTMVSNTFLQNSGANGGAVWQNNLKLVNHTLNLFVANKAPKGSAGIELNQVTSMSVDNCNFTSGTGNKGGAIYTQVSRVRVRVRVLPLMRNLPTF